MSIGTQQWGGTPHARRCALVLTASLALALAFGRPALAVVAAAPAAFLMIRSQRPQASVLDVTVTVDEEWQVEDEAVQATVRVRSRSHFDGVRVEARPGPRMVATPAVLISESAAEASLQLTYRAMRWGRWSLGALEITGYRDALRESTAVAVPLPRVSFAPRPAPVRALAVRPIRVDAVGEHPGRTAETGMEFAGTRPYQPGDSARRVHWPTTLRRGRLHVRRGVGDYAVDVVLVVDALDDIGPVGASSLDLGVRGALGVAQALLRQRDRVGLITLGGWLRWLRPAYGQRQFTRMMTGLLEARMYQTYVDPDVELAAAAAVRPGSRVIMFSPLADERAAAAVTRLRATGSTVTVIDVLPAIARPVRPLDQVAWRLWLLERAALRGELAALGVPVLSWDGVGPVDLVLAPVMSRPAVRA